MRAHRTRRMASLLMLAALAFAPAGCRKRPEGTVRAVVIGSGMPKLADPVAGPLSEPDSVLTASVAQGLVRFDAGGNIVAGLAERWNVSNDGLSYIFRLASTSWPDGRKLTAQQVARILKREMAPRSRDALKDSVGAVEDVVAMTDRVLEIQLIAPRPNFLPLLAQPEFAIMRDGAGTGPFELGKPTADGDLQLSREIDSSDEETSRRETVLLSAADARRAVLGFVNGQSELVLGGTFADLPFAIHARLPRGTLRFDPASGLFGLVPVSAGGPLDSADKRRLLSAAIDRDSLIAALSVPGLAARATVLEPGLDGVPQPVQPAWFATAFADRRPTLLAQAARLFGSGAKPPIRIALPQGPGADILFARLAADWGALGFQVSRAANDKDADFRLIDLVAPSSSPAWFLRSFRCEAVPVCNPDADTLLEAAREAPVPAQRYALLSQAASKIDDLQLFIPLTAPVRWSLVSGGIQGFAGNRYASHTLTDLEQKLTPGE